MFIDVRRQFMDTLLDCMKFFLLDRFAIITLCIYLVIEKIEVSRFLITLVGLLAFFQIGDIFNSNLE